MPEPATDFGGFSDISHCLKQILAISFFPFPKAMPIGGIAM
jgi:hypothetical protein